MKNISIKNLDLRIQKDFFESHFIYNNEVRDTRDIAIEYYNKLGYDAFGDTYLFFKAILCFFWEDIYDDEPSSENISTVIENVQMASDMSPIIDLCSLPKDIVNSRINNAKNNNFRNILYNRLHGVCVDFYTEDSPMVLEYLSNSNNSFDEKLFEFYKNLPREVFVDYLEYYEEEFDDDIIDEYMKIHKALFSLITNKKEIDLNYLNDLDIDCDKDIFEDYEYFAEYFMNECSHDAVFYLLDDDFTSFLENHFNHIKKVLDSFSDDELLMIFKRAVEAYSNFYAFPRVFVFKDDVFYLIYFISDDVEPTDDYDTLWQYFFLNDLEKNVEFLTFNYSKNKQTRFLNNFKQHKNNLEIFYEDSNGDVLSKKFKINDNKELINEWRFIEDIYNNKKVSSIFLNKKEIEFKMLEKIFQCVLNRFENDYNYDYCFIYQEGYVLKTCCRCLNSIMPEIDSQRFYFDKNDFCHFNLKTKIVTFNKKVISNHYKKTTADMHFCPFFKKSNVHKFVKNLPKQVNYKNTVHWNFVCENDHKWFRFKNKWFNEEGSFNFPGFKKLVAIEKTDEDIRNRAKLWAFPEEKEKINNGKINLDMIKAISSMLGDDNW